jgi:phosphatidylinositol glycan class M
MAWSKYTPPILAASAAIQAALVAYAAYVDAHPEAFGGLRYTDIDWRVVLDGLHATFAPAPHQRAEGPLPLPIGSPYHRATFRYTPLLVLVLSPAALAPFLGRLVLVALTLALPPVLLAAGAIEWKVHALWTLNPIVINISTRGSPEALPCLLTALLALALRRAGLGRGPSASNARGWEAAAAVVLALAASYKIYPAIYVPAIWSALARAHGWFGVPVWRFGLIAAATALLLNGALWLV